MLWILKNNCLYLFFILFQWFLTSQRFGVTDNVWITIVQKNKSYAAPTAMWLYKQYNIIAVWSVSLSATELKKDWVEKEWKDNPPQRKKKEKLNNIRISNVDLERKCHVMNKASKGFGLFDAALNCTYIKHTNTSVQAHSDTCKLIHQSSIWPWAPSALQRVTSIRRVSVAITWPLSPPGRKNIQSMKNNSHFHE